MSTRGQGNLGVYIPCFSRGILVKAHILDVKYVISQQLTTRSSAILFIVPCSFTVSAFSYNTQRVLPLPLPGR